VPARKETNATTNLTYGIVVELDQDGRLVYYPAER
jgi:hypothetical protein